jgi:hypothetical protein
VLSDFTICLFVTFYFHLLTVSGGRLIVQCTSATGTNSCVVVDYVTDHVTTCQSELAGDVHVSPDVKYIVVVHNNETKMSVYTLDEYGACVTAQYSLAQFVYYRHICAIVNFHTVNFSSKLQQLDGILSSG